MSDSVSSNHISIEFAPLYSKNIAPSLTSALSEDNPEFSTSTSPSSVNANPKVSTKVYITAGVGVGGTGVGVGGTGVGVGGTDVGVAGTGVFGTTASGSAVGVVLTGTVVADSIGVGTDVAVGLASTVATSVVSGDRLSFP